MTVAFGLAEAYKRDIAQAEIRSRNLSLAMDIAISNEIAKIDLSLQTVAREIEASSGHTRRLDYSRIQNLVADQKSLLRETEAWSVSDASGQVLISEGEVRYTNFSVADRAYFSELKSGQKSGLIVSTPVHGKLTGVVVVVLARAYRDDAGRFAGVVAASLPLSYFNHFLSRFDVGPRGLLTLRAADLGLIARISPGYSKNSSPIGEQQVTPPLRNLIQSGVPIATIHAVTPFDQVERIISYRLLDVAPIYVLVGISKPDFLAEWQRLCWITLGFLLLFLLLTNTSAILLYRQWRRQRRYGLALNASNSRLAQSLQEVRERDIALSAAQEAGKLGTYALNIQTGVWTNSEQLNTIFGIDDGYVRTIETWQHLIHPEDQQQMASYVYEDVIGRRGLFDREYRIVRPSDGKERWVHGLGKLTFDTEGKPVTMHGTIQDVSERKYNEARLNLSQEVFQSASEGIMVTDKAGIIREINPAFSQITGYAHDEVIGRTPRLLNSGAQTPEFYQGIWDSILGKGMWEGEIVNRRKNGGLYVQHTRISAIVERGAPSGFAALISDITELKESQRQLEYLAYHDKLTGLPNRVALARRIDRAIVECRERDELLGVCYIDLDVFKPVNDEWGHEVGDQLLIEVANRLQASVRGGDTVARMGGDEFVILLSGCKSKAELEAAASRILASNVMPHQIGEFRSTLTMSVGVTFYPNDMVEDADALIRHADQAMYEAKRNGKNRVHFYDLESARKLREHQTQYARIVQALAQNEFCLHYQPKVDMRSGAVIGVEALIRWQHPEQGLLAPARFLSVIEATELTLAVGEWILHEVMRQKRHWQAQGISLTVSVNIFALHLQRADFVERIKHILQAYPDIDPRGLEFEILETTAMEDLDEISTRIRQCMALGIGFALDDFGTGYSSLTYFRQLPVSVVKIDRSFVRDMLVDENDRTLVESIIGMAHMLKRKAVAEGVETLEHGIPLIRSGCDLAQGYGIARPMAPAMLPSWLAHWELPELWRGLADERLRAPADEVDLFG